MPQITSDSDNDLYFSETSVSVSTSEQTSVKRLKLTPEELANLATSSTRYQSFDPLSLHPPPCLASILRFLSQAKLTSLLFALPNLPITHPPFPTLYIAFTKYTIFMEVLKYLRAAQHTHPFLLLTHFLKPILINQTHVPLPNNFHIVHCTPSRGQKVKIANQQHCNNSNKSCCNCFQHHPELLVKGGKVSIYIYVAAASKSFQGEMLVKLIYCTFLHFRMIG